VTGGEPELPLRAVAAAVIVRAGRVLVQTRTEGPWAGWWEFPGGRIEAGEDAPAAAARECAEELGLRATPRAVLHEVEWSYPAVRVHVSFVECEVEGEPQALEGQDFAWAGPAELLALRFLPANATLVALLRERLADQRSK
jgi:8-oxo-dGTP diphosphatase